MAVSITKKRLPVTLDEQRMKNVCYLSKKYGKSQSKIMAIALDMLAEQEKSGFKIMKLEK